MFLGADDARAAPDLDFHGGNFGGVQLREHPVVGRIPGRHADGAFDKINKSEKERGGGEKKAGGFGVHVGLQA